MNRNAALFALFLASAAPAVWDTPTITSDTTWSGDLVLRQSVVVSPGATLRIAPGTNVLVESEKKIGISVMGRLVISGESSNPVSFVPEKPGSSRVQWEGIRLSGGRNAGHTLAAFRLSGAREGISLTETSAKISGAVLSGCEAGLRGYQKSAVTLDNCVFDGNDTGAFLSLGGEAVFRDSRFVNILGAGIFADKGAAISVANGEFSRGKTGIFSLTDSPCRIEGCRFVSLGKAIVARQMGGNSSVSRCTFENDDTGILAVQFCSVEISDCVFLGNQTAVNLFRKSHPVVEANVFFHNRNGVTLNYSSYPKIARNNFDRNDMSVRLEKFQSGDWEERAGSPALTGGEAARRGSRNPGIGKAVQYANFPKRVNAKGNYWGPDAGRDPEKGTLGKIQDGNKFGPVKYEGFGEEEYRIDVVDFSEESAVPFTDAGPRGGDGKKETK